VHVAQTDMGKVIGKQGRTVRALRALVYAAGLKQRRKLAPNPSRHRTHPQHLPSVSQVE